MSFRINPTLIINYCIVFVVCIPEVSLLRLIVVTSTFHISYCHVFEDRTDGFLLIHQSALDSKFQLFQIIFNVERK